jgi:hypothetical protein
VGDQRGESNPSEPATASTFLDFKSNRKMIGFSGALGIQGKRPNAIRRPFGVAPPPAASLSLAGKNITIDCSSISNAQGTIQDSNVTNVVVTCNIQVN